jgi:protocatechuate 3,4-dioxygenase beta subunit
LFIGLPQGQAGLAQTKERCVLAGTVVNSATNEGIPRAMVFYYGPETGYRFTDVGGNFRVENVPCQGYALKASKPGFVSAEDPIGRLGVIMGAPDGEDGQAEQAGQAPRPANISFDLKPDAAPAHIALLPVASIVGLVLDENGEPLAGVAVQSIAVKAAPSGGSDYLPGKSARTDDRGHYEFLNLQPGDYVVRLAGEVSSTRYFQGNTLNPNNDHRGMQPIYYPDVDSISSAMVLHAGPGERANADFRHPTEPAFDINGQLTNFVAQAHTTLQLYREGDKIPLGSSYVNLTTGQFRVVDVPPGSYTLRAQQYQADPPKWLAAELPVTMRASPVADLELPLAGGADIPVTVSYDAGAQEGTPVQISLQPQHSRENARYVTVGKFPRARRPVQAPSPSEAGAQPEEAPAPPSVLSNVLPDKYKMTVQALGNGGYVASAKLGDMDVLHGEFPIGNGGGELHVTLRGDGATVEGKVTFNGQPAQGAQVFLMAAAAGGRPGLGFTDEEGHYQITGVAPGDYRIRAWVGVPSPKEMFSDAGESVTLEASEQRTMALEAVQGSAPSPKGQQ